MAISPVCRFVGKCKECGAQCRIEGRPGTGTNGHSIVMDGDTLFMGGALGMYTHQMQGTCVCGRVVQCELVYQGKKASKHKCSGICRSAKGPSCDCLCGGENHGAG
jgi:hypothetical protein